MRRTGPPSPLVAGAAALAMAAALAAPCAAALAAGAQSPPQSTSRRTGPELVVPGGTNGRSLSARLNRSGGVLHPPLLGPHSTPVIPPPGTPGGNPNIKPK
jgi:hypothetical protein